MSQPGTIYRFLIASPADCAGERLMIPGVIHAWNAVHSESSGMILEPVLWETHARPELGDRPQALINKQLLQKCDALVGTFWTRLGTPTGSAPSGTAEEIEEFRKAGKSVLLYFSLAPVAPDSIDQDQFRALVEYRKKLEEKGLIFRYTSIQELREQFQRHLAATVLSWTTGRKAPEFLEQRDTRVLARLEANELDSLVRRMAAGWSAERDSAPTGIEAGKAVMLAAVPELVALSARLPEDDADASRLRAFAKELKVLGRHQLYIDGGVSFGAFWEQGTKIIDQLKSFSTELRAKTARQTSTADQPPASDVKKEENVLERAVRLNRDVAAANERVKLLRSDEGVQTAEKELRALFDDLQTLASKVSTVQLPFNFKGGDRHSAAIWAPGTTLVVDWSAAYTNSLDNSSLESVIWKGAPPLPNRFPKEPPSKLHTGEYHFDLDASSQPGWRRVGDTRFLTSKHLAEALVRDLLEAVEKARLPRP